MATHSRDLVRLFAALSDPTRLAVVERLSAGPLSVSELAAPFSMAGPSFLKHLGVLDAAGLITSQKVGRVRSVQLRPERLAEVRDWIDQHRQNWERRLDRLGSILKDDAK